MQEQSRPKHGIIALSVKCFLPNDVADVGMIGMTDAGYILTKSLLEHTFHDEVPCLVGHRFRDLAHSIDHCTFMRMMEYQMGQNLVGRCEALVAKDAQVVPTTTLKSLAKQRSVR